MNSNNILWKFIHLLSTLYPIESSTIELSKVSQRLEVHGLPKGAIPENCEVVTCGEERNTKIGERRSHYLVELDGYYVYLRIYSDRDDINANEYAEVVGIAAIGSDDGEDLREHGLNTVMGFCN